MACIFASLKLRNITPFHKNKIGSDKYLQAVMNTVLDGLVIIDAKGIVQSFNPAAEKIFGYQSKEVIGNNVSMLMPEPYHSEHDRYLKNYLDTGNKKIIGIGREALARKKDGSTFPIALSINEMLLDDELMFVGTIRDISESVAAAAIRESDVLKTAMLSSTKYLVVATDINGIVVIFNAAAEKALGYKAEEIIGNSVPILWHDHEEVAKRAEVLSAELGIAIKPGFDAFIKKAEITGEDTNEWNFIRKDKTNFPANLVVTCLRDKNKKIIGYLGVIEDLTERKKIDRIKSEFTSIVSHELRTPLTSIYGALGLILGTFSQDLSSKVKGLINIAYSNCERLNLLINDILDIEKIALGKMRLEMKDESLAVFTQKAIEANEHYAQKFNVTIESEVIDENIKIKIDSSRYIQVLSNLLSNAAKFSAPGDKVKIFTTQKGDRIRISVKDNGPGIPEEFRARIFEKFSQSDSPDTRSKGGTGLGLYIAKNMVEQMNGIIGYDTEVGKGTTFWIEFLISK